MRMLNRYLYGIVVFSLLGTPLFWSCGDDSSKQSKPLVVSKKIPATDKPKSDSQADQTKKETTTTDTAEAKIAGETNVSKRIYDPAKRLNPFIPLYKSNQDKASAIQPGKSKRKKRVPQTPLERISLEQLQLRAIIRAPSGNRALVEDNSGKGYIIKAGTYIGLNSGIVTQIDADSVVVEEEVENIMGELVLQNTEIKLQKQTGE